MVQMKPGHQENVDDSEDKQKVFQILMLPQRAAVRGRIQSELNFHVLMEDFFPQKDFQRGGDGNILRAASSNKHFGGSTLYLFTQLSFSPSFF